MPAPSQLGATGHFSLLDIARNCLDATKQRIDLLIQETRQSPGHEQHQEARQIRSPAASTGENNDDRDYDADDEENDDDADRNGADEQERTRQQRQRVWDIYLNHTIRGRSPPASERAFYLPPLVGDVRTDAHLLAAVCQSHDIPSHQYEFHFRQLYGLNVKEVLKYNLIQRDLRRQERRSRQSRISIFGCNSRHDTITNNSAVESSVYDVLNAHATMILQGRSRAPELRAAMDKFLDELRRSWLLTPMPDLASNSHDLIRTHRHLTSWLERDPPHLIAGGAMNGL